MCNVRLTGADCAGKLQCESRGGSWECDISAKMLVKAWSMVMVVLGVVGSRVCLPPDTSILEQSVIPGSVVDVAIFGQVNWIINRIAIS